MTDKNAVHSIGTGPKVKKPVLALLETREIEQCVPWAGLTVIAELLGLEFRRPEMFGDSNEHWKTIWAEIGDLIETADAFIIKDGVVLSEFSKQLRSRIANGARIVVIPDRNRLTETNAFLGEFGLAGTDYRILPKASAGAIALTIPRSADCYLDRELLEGVDIATFNSLRAVYFERDALPVLLANQESWAVDTTTDFEVTWNRLKLSCIARWEGASGGAVVVLGDNVFWDNGRRWTDLSLMPGIQQNAMLSANLLRYLGRMAAVTVSPAQHCERAEKNLATFVLTAVKLHFGEEWWADAIPQNIREKCAVRQEQEVKRKFPREAFLDIVDLKAIIEKQWSLVFQPYFKQIGESQGKDKAVAWIDKFNELRRLVAHPLKAHLADYSMSSQEIAFTQEVDDRAFALLNSLPQQS